MTPRSRWDSGWRCFPDTSRGRAHAGPARGADENLTRGIVDNRKRSSGSGSGSSSCGRHDLASEGKGDDGMADGEREKMKEGGGQGSGRALIDSGKRYFGSENERALGVESAAIRNDL